MQTGPKSGRQSAGHNRQSRSPGDPRIPGHPAGQLPPALASQPAEASWSAGPAKGAGRPGAGSRELGVQERRLAGGCWVGARPAVQMHFTLFPEGRQSTADSRWPDSPTPCPPVGLPGHRGPPHPCPEVARKRQEDGPQAALASVHGAVGGPSRPWDPDFADVRSVSEMSRAFLAIQPNPGTP